MPDSFVGSKSSLATPYVPKPVFVEITKTFLQNYKNASALKGLPAEAVLTQIWQSPIFPHLLWSG